ncbi:hypothetical protein [Hyphobacterium sp.]|uniref:hypothetical protein n=1 Tax=Hyphobacterium sp. TaxID=2004662 RepID=UPI0037495102
MVKLNIPAIMGSTAIFLAGFGLVASPGMTRDDLFMADLDGNPVQPVTCPSETFSVLAGQQVTEVDLATLPRPFEVHGEERPPLATETPNRLLIAYDANGVVTEVSCG